MQNKTNTGKKGKNVPVTGRGGPIGLWDVEALTFSRQSANRWRWGCQPYAPTTLYSLGRFLVHISVRGWVDPSAIMRLEVLRKLKISNDLIGNLNRCLPACSIAPPKTQHNTNLIRVRYIEDLLYIISHVRQLIHCPLLNFLFSGLFSTFCMCCVFYVF
jgi:hypothetical protein